MISVSDVGVVVVTYQSASTINECLQRLLAATGVTRVVVVDNASSDATTEKVAWLAIRDARLKLVRNDDNRGFSEACNQGASALDTPWVAFVNPDLFVEPNTLSRLVAHARSHAGAGLIGAELHDATGVTDPAARRRDLSLRELFDNRGQRADQFLGRDPALQLQPVEATSGALMLMPLGLFLQIGGFDEGYRLHVEDLDLCRRVREAGYEVMVANDVVATHLRGVSSRTRPVWVEWQKHRSAWRYFRKFESDQVPARLRPVLWLGLWGHCLGVVARHAALRTIGWR